MDTSVIPPPPKMEGFSYCNDNSESQKLRILNIMHIYSVCHIQFNSCNSAHSLCMHTEDLFKSRTEIELSLQ